jgi:hypothetical protein
MADKPIIFSAPMVRALLDGKKTQTRRIIKPQPGPAVTGCAVYVKNEVMTNNWMWLHGKPGCQTEAPAEARLHLPFRAGDRLYVREAFWLCGECGHRNMCADGVNYSGFPDRGCCSSCDELLPRAKTSPIHMPRGASRITLTVSGVWVHRLQHILEVDARAEGVICDSDGWRDYQMPHTQCCATATDSYRTLWNSLHGPEAWDANPWVAAYSFTVQRGNIDQIGGKA